MRYRLYLIVLTRGDFLLASFTFHFPFLFCPSLSFLFLSSVDGIMLIYHSEYHDSTDREQASLTLKLFLSTYFNLIIVVLVAFTRYDGVPDSLKQIHFLQGLFTDFDPKWYPVVGGYYIITYVLEVFTILMTNCLGYYIFQPLMRCLHYRSIDAARSHKVVVVIKTHH